MRQIVSAKLVKAALAKQDAQCRIVIIETVEQAEPVLTGVDFEALEAAHAIVRRDEIDLSAGGQTIFARERLHKGRRHRALKLAQISVGAELARRGCAHEGSGWL